MAITSAITNSFKVEVLQGLHNFTTTTGGVMKCALYSSSATLDASTTAYTATNEISGTGYSAGGNTLTNITPALSSSTACVDFADVTWSGATFTARGALIYNSSASNKAVCVIDFGANRGSVGADFTLVFPTADASNAIIRIA